MIKIKAKFIFLSAWTAALILFSVSSLACNVPVFRYALERWPADLYDVVVFHSGPFSTEDASVVKWLENTSAAVPYANFTVQTVDIDSRVSPSLLELWETLDEPETPCLVVRYPFSVRYRQSIWSGRLTMDAAKALVDSPVRREIARRILAGESAVWVFLESGDSTKDDAAAHILQSQLSALEKTLTLPGPINGTYGFTPDFEINGLELRVSFSMIRLSRKDPRESIFIEMLMHSEPDLSEYISHPMAFPVYGRGRALYALVGEGITERNISEACQFVTGACSCEVKVLNPGVDLLMAVDWDAGLRESWIQDADLPPLVGLSELVHATGTGDSVITAFSDDTAVTADSVSHEAIAIHEDHEEPSQPGRSEGDFTGEADNVGDGSRIAESSGSLFRNTLLALGVIVLIITMLTLRMGVHKAENKR